MKMLTYGDLARVEDLGQEIVSSYIYASIRKNLSGEIHCPYEKFNPYGLVHRTIFLVALFLRESEDVKWILSISSSIEGECADIH